MNGVLLARKLHILWQQSSAANGSGLGPRKVAAGGAASAARETTTAVAVAVVQL